MSETRITADVRAMQTMDRGRVGGVLLSLPSGLQVSAYWREPGLIGDTLATAKAIAAQLLQHLLEQHQATDVDRVNWVSVTAAVQRIVADWNEARRAALYAEQEGAAGGEGRALH